MNISEIAKKIRLARLRGENIPQITDEYPEFSVEDAYAAQLEQMRMDVEDGGPLPGFKMGLTSVAKQRDVGVHEPICGYLIPGSLISLGQSLHTDGKIHPRVESEIAVRFSEDISNVELNEHSLLNCIDKIVLGLEVLDSRYRDFKFKLSDVIADNTSACGFCVGEKPWNEGWDALTDVPLVLKKNGDEVGRGFPSAVLDNPKHSVEMFARMAKRLGFQIQKGMWLLTGGITASVSVQAGDRIELESPWDRMALEVARRNK